LAAFLQLVVTQASVLCRIGCNITANVFADKNAPQHGVAIGYALLLADLFGLFQVLAWFPD